MACTWIIVWNNWKIIEGWLDEVMIGLMCYDRLVGRSCLLMMYKIDDRRNDERRKRKIACAWIWALPSYSRLPTYPISTGSRHLTMEMRCSSDVVFYWWEDKNGLRLMKYWWCDDMWWIELLLICWSYWICFDSWLDVLWFWCLLLLGWLFWWLDCFEWW